LIKVLENKISSREVEEIIKDALEREMK